MTGKAHRENANYSILLQQEPALKKDDITKLKQEFILIAKQYIPYQNRYDSCIEAIFAEFLSLLQPEKIATSLEDNIVLLTENISDFCKNKRANISHNAQLNALKNLPKQSKMLGTLLSREPACAPAKSEAPQETLIEKKKTVGQLIHWTPIVERVCLAMNIGDVILSGHHTKQERNFLAINPIVWYKEFAAHENISAEEAFSRIMKSNSVVATSKYRKASTKQKIKQRMKALFPANQNNSLIVYQQQKISFQQKLRSLLKWTQTSSNQQSLLKYLPNLSTHASKIAIGITYQLPTNRYITSIMIKHLYDESRALQFLHKVDIRDWEERIFLLVPEEDPQVGRDAEILFLAIKELEDKEKKSISKVKNAN